MAYNPWTLDPMIQFLIIKDGMLKIDFQTYGSDERPTLEKSAFEFLYGGQFDHVINPWGW